MDRISRLLRNDRFIYFLFLFLIIAVVTFRIVAETDGYVSPDGACYLSAAENIVKGRGAVVKPDCAVQQADGNLQHEFPSFTIWPLGYPWLIASLSYISGLSVLVSSKLVNFLCLILSGLLLRKIYPCSFVFPFLLFCTFPLLEIMSHSWSENPFICFLLLLVLTIRNILKENQQVALPYFLLTFSLVGLFLCRYIGIFFCAFAYLIVVYLFHNGEKRKSAKVFISLIVATFLIITYLYYNYSRSGFITGTDRIGEIQMTVAQFALRVFLGLISQLNFFRYLNLKETSLFATLFIIQFLVMAFVFKSTKWGRFFDDKSNMIFVISSFLYLLVLIPFTAFSGIDMFDYRTLAPWSFCLFVPVLSWLNLELKNQGIWRKQLAYYGLMMIVLLFNLPKKYLMELIG
ncbi:MAG: hypothetical protein ACK40G_16920 [Cytophagaceae bacterium]